MVFQVAQDKAISFISENIDKVDLLRCAATSGPCHILFVNLPPPPQVLNYGDGFSLNLLELIRHVGRADASKKARFIRIVFSLLDTPSAAVSYEAASTLVALSAAPSAVRAAASTFIKILNKESDNNVKLIVLERLASLRRRHTKVLRDLVMDILRCVRAARRWGFSKGGRGRRALKRSSAEQAEQTLDVPLALLTACAAHSQRRTMTSGAVHLTSRWTWCPRATSRRSWRS
jgi:hypothetical protein